MSILHTDDSMPPGSVACLKKNTNQVSPYLVLPKIWERTRRIVVSKNVSQPIDKIKTERTSNPQPTKSNPTEPTRARANQAFQRKSFGRCPPSLRQVLSLRQIALKGCSGQLLNLCANSKCKLMNKKICLNCWTVWESPLPCGPRRLEYILAASVPPHNGASAYERSFYGWRRS